MALLRAASITIFVIGLHGVAAAQTSSAESSRSAQSSADRAKDSGFQWAPTGHIQIDAHSYADWDVEGTPPRVQRDTLEMRRIRLGFDTSWHDLDTEFSVDPLDGDGFWLKEARIDWRSARWLRVRAGQFKLPGGREYGTTTRRLGFLERSPLSESLAAGRDLGAQVNLRSSSVLQTELGLFAGDGAGRDDRSGLTTAGRVSYEPLKHLDLGGYFSFGQARSALDAEPPTGINGRSTSTYRFFDRLYVNGHRSRVGADVQWATRHWRANGEVMRLREQRREQAADFSDLPDLVGDAATLSLRWQPGRPEFGVRYEWLDFDDAGPETGIDSVRPRAADVRARGIHGVTVSAGWQVSRWLRAIGEVATERYTDARSAPVAGRAGPYVTIGARLQIEIP